MLQEPGSQHKSMNHMGEDENKCLTRRAYTTSLCPTAATRQCRTRVPDATYLSRNLDSQVKSSNILKYWKWIQMKTHKKLQVTQKCLYIRLKPMTASLWPVVQGYDIALNMKCINTPSPSQLLKKKKTTKKKLYHVKCIHWLPGILPSEVLKYKNMGVFLGLKTCDMCWGHAFKYEKHPSWWWWRKRCRMSQNSSVTLNSTMGSSWKACKASGCNSHTNEIIMNSSIPHPFDCAINCFSALLIVAIYNTSFS